MPEYKESEKSFFIVLSQFLIIEEIHFQKFYFEFRRNNEIMYTESCMAVEKEIFLWFSSATARRFPPVSAAFLIRPCDQTEGAETKRTARSSEREPLPIICVKYPESKENRQSCFKTRLSLLFNISQSNMNIFSIHCCITYFKFV